MVDFAEKRLVGSGLHLAEAPKRRVYRAVGVKASTYHVGEGYAAKLELQPDASSNHTSSQVRSLAHLRRCGQVAKTLDTLENDLLTSDLEAWI